MYQKKPLVSRTGCTRKNPWFLVKDVPEKTPGFSYRMYQKKPLVPRKGCTRKNPWFLVQDVPERKPWFACRMCQKEKLRNTVQQLQMSGKFTVIRDWMSGYFCGTYCTVCNVHLAMMMMMMTCHSLSRRLVGGFIPPFNIMLWGEERGGMKVQFFLSLSTCLIAIRVFFALLVRKREVEQHKRFTICFNCRGTQIFKMFFYRVKFTYYVTYVKCKNLGMLTVLTCRLSKLATLLIYLGIWKNTDVLCRVTSHQWTD